MLTAIRRLLGWHKLSLYVVSCTPPTERLIGSVNIALSIFDAIQAGENVWFVHLTEKQNAETISVLLKDHLTADDSYMVCEFTSNHHIRFNNKVSSWLEMR